MVVAGELASVIGICLLALRCWPERMVPLLSPSLAIALSDVVGDDGLDAVGDRLRRDDAEAAVIAALEGSDADKRRMCLLLTRRWTTADLTDGVRERLYRLHRDSAVGDAVRPLLPQPVPHALNWLARQVQAGDWTPSDQPTTPDGWIPGPVARRALALWAFLGAVYDHRMPSPHRETVATLVAQILAAQDADGLFSADPRDHALVVDALGWLHATSHDAELQTVIMRAVPGLRHGDATQVWRRDTTLAMLQYSAWQSIASGGLVIDDGCAALVEGFDAAWAAAGPSHDRLPWYADGREVPMPPWASLGAARWVGLGSGRPHVVERIADQFLTPEMDLRTLAGQWCARAARDPVGQEAIAQRLSVLRATQVYRWKDVDDGSWDPAPGVGDRLHVTVFSVMSLQPR